MNKRLLLFLPFFFCFFTLFSQERKDEVKTGEKDENSTLPEGVEIIADYNPHVLRVISFKGEFNGKQVVLTWSGEVKPPVSIEFSMDGKHFKKIGEVSSAAGFEKDLFEFRTTEFVSNVNYYRILKTDVSKKVYHSSIVELDLDSKLNYELSTTKTESGLEVFFQHKASEEKVKIYLSDSEGEEKILYEGNLMSGEMLKRTIDKESFLKSTYFLRVDSKSYTISKKIDLR